MFFVFRDSYVLCIYVTNILCTFHIFMYLAMLHTHTHTHTHTYIYIYIYTHMHMNTYRLFYTDSLNEQITNSYIKINNEEEIIKPNKNVRACLCKVEIADIDVAQLITEAEGLKFSHYSVTPKLKCPVLYILIIIIMISISIQRYMYTNNSAVQVRTFITF